MEYRQLSGRDVWHFHPDCHHMMGNFRLKNDPRTKVSVRKPKSGELCNECLSKVKRGKKQR